MTDTPSAFCNTCGRGESFFPSCALLMCPQKAARGEHIAEEWRAEHVVPVLGGPDEDDILRERLQALAEERAAVEAPVPVEVVVNLDLPMVVGMRLGSAFLGALKALEGVPDLEARTEAALRLTGLVAASPTLLGLLTEGSE